jgi:hypothetical protein
MADAVFGRPSAAELDQEQRAFLAKQAELDQRIRCLECKFHGQDGRITTLERRQREDPAYTGPERRFEKRVNH